MTSPNTLPDAIRNAILYQLMNIHTAFPAQIISYDYTVKKASVQPLINKNYTSGIVQAMPVLNNIPIVFPYSSGASLTFPVNKGDYCLIICCERSIDEFLANGGQVTPLDPRKLDLSDAVGIMGLLPFTESSPANNNDDLLLAYQGSSITIKKSGDILINTSAKVAIGNSTTELLNVLSQTLGLLATSVTTAPSTPFAFATQWATLKTALDAITGTIP